MRKYIVHGAVAVFVFVGIFFLQRQFVDSEVVQSIAGMGGYTGVFVFSFFNSFNFFLPIVTPTLTPTWVSAGLSFPLVVLAMVAAISIVDIGFYFVGRFSRRAFRNHPSKTLERLTRLQEKNHVLPLVFFAGWVLFAPLPNELVTMPLGFLGYRFLSVGTIIIIGNILFNGFIAWQALRALQLVGM